jgi:hypothetical protein
MSLRHKKASKCNVYSINFNQWRSRSKFFEEFFFSPEIEERKWHPFRGTEASVFFLKKINKLDHVVGDVHLLLVPGGEADPSPQPRQPTPSCQTSGGNTIKYFWL